jgi:hypothetical protein
VGRTKFGALYTNVRYHYLDNSNLTLQNVDLNMNHKLTEALNLGASYFFTGKYDTINKNAEMAPGQLPGRLLPVQAHRRRHHLATRRRLAMRPAPCSASRLRRQDAKRADRRHATLFLI